MVCLYMPNDDHRKSHYSRLHFGPYTIGNNKSPTVDSWHDVLPNKFYRLHEFT